MNPKPRSTTLLSIFATIALFIVLPMVSANSATECRDAVPYPSDMQITKPAPGLPDGLAAFVGHWAGGNRNGGLCGALVVERVEPGGDAHVIYTWGPGDSFDPGYVREVGKVEGSPLRVQLRWTEVVYDLIDPTHLKGRYYRNGVWSITLTKQ